MTEFKAWPKTPRLFRDVVITEKIDGTNACVIVTPWDGEFAPDDGSAGVYMDENETHWRIAAQSRNRIITPDADNFGFARWVWDNGHQLVAALGEGYHYGEWWGSGIQRGYGLPKGEKRFSLFNVTRWEKEMDFLTNHVDGLFPVPTLYSGVFSENVVRSVLDLLEEDGSSAAPGFANPEGICVFHTQSRQVYKVLIENDDLSKTEANNGRV